MLDYRVYILDTDGSIREAKFIQATDDARVIEIVRDRSMLTDCEIWQLSRKVALVPADGGDPVVE